MVYDAVKGKVGFEYEDLDEQTLKNIAELIRVQLCRFEFLLALSPMT